MRDGFRTPQTRYPVNLSSNAIGPAVRNTNLRESSVSKLVAGLCALALCVHAYAAGETGPPGMQGLPAALLMISIYPFVGIALSFVLFKITGKALVFFLAPLFYTGLIYVTPIDPSSPDSGAPGFFSAAGAWLYWTHILAIAVTYRMYSKNRKVWLFWLSPLIGWVIQVVSLIALLIWH